MKNNDKTAFDYQPNKTPYVAPFIRRLMPHASEEEILEASENLRAYLEIGFRLFLEQKRKKTATNQPKSSIPVEDESN